MAAPRWLADVARDGRVPGEPRAAREERSRRADPLPGAAAAPGVRLLTLNVAHGRKLATHQALLSPRTVRRNLEEIASLLRDSRADVVALQEADGPSAWSGNFDHVELLMRLADHACHFRGEHNAFNLGRAALASGTALISRLPLQAPRSLRFGTSWRDTKGFVLATVPVPAWDGLELDVVSLHLEPFNPVIRRQQVRQLADALTVRRRRPLAILGDFNCSWSEEARQLRPLARELGLRPYQPQRRAPTYPSRRPWRRLDWILISPELDFASYSTLPNPVSDHLGVVADLVPRALGVRRGAAEMAGWKMAESPPAASGGGR
ncbi:MAG TPA: endonuclease/exonuclease/phosphatase family protein [Thermoanaerobaculia bacterium]|nr:endonuclease/exonuclease/phosphatase family protein [Thermoanaerobaculia bacterium]